MTTLILLASLTAAGYAASYLSLCVASPWGHCRKCAGAGKLHPLGARSLHRLCPRCDGFGRRVRIGRRIYEYLRAEHDRGTP